MSDALFWIYLLNAVVLIVHEIDSAYQKEWELFKLPGGVTGFLLLHFPILLFVLYGLVLVREGSKTGLVFSLVLAAGGIFAFSIHSWFIRRGHDEFTSPLSRTILYATLMLSIVQVVLTVFILS